MPRVGSIHITRVIASQVHLNLLNLKPSPKTMGKILQMVRAWIPLLWTILALVLILVLAVPSKRTSGNVIGLGYLVGVRPHETLFLPGLTKR